jgi:hypothetical protein
MQASLLGLSPRGLEAPGFAGGWGARELAIHLEGWFRVALESIPIFARGERRATDYNDFDAWNARFIEDASALPATEAFARLEGTYGLLLAYLRDLPADLYERHAIADTIEGVSWGHFGEHYYDVWRFRGANGWLPAPLTLADIPGTRIDGLRALWADYDRLYGSMLGLSDEQLEEPGVDGDWAIRDVVSHIAAWQRAVVNEVPKVLVGIPTSADVEVADAFNARAVAEARGRPLDALFAEYHSANNHFFAYANTLVDAVFAPGSRAREWMMLPHGSEHWPQIWEWRNRRGV